MKFIFNLTFFATQLISSAQSCDQEPLIGNAFSLHSNLVHSIAQDNAQKPANYPDRVVSPAAISWDFIDLKYKSIKYTHPVIIENSRNNEPAGWAEADDFNLICDPESKHYREITSIIGPIRYDQEGLPLNPGGRTGISGRGNLTKWGVNLAADPIITRLNPQSGQIQMLAIKRKDNGQWAIPGGMVDHGDSVGKTLEKELKEETGIELTMTNAITVYKGYVDDPRNTDNAWIETFAKHMHLSDDDPIAHMEPTAGDDAAKTQWKDCTDEFINILYASHSLFVRTALEKMKEKMENCK